MKSKNKDKLEEFLVSVFNTLGFLGLASFAMVGLVMHNSIRGVPILDNILVSCVVLFTFIGFMFAKKVV